MLARSLAVIFFFSVLNTFLFEATAGDKNQLLTDLLFSFFLFLEYCKAFQPFRELTLFALSLLLQIGYFPFWLIELPKFLGQLRTENPQRETTICTVRNS